MNLFYFFIVKELFTQPGSQLDNGCVIDGGYTWCNSLKELEVKSDIEYLIDDLN